jgi:hypothetical protein
MRNVKRALRLANKQSIPQLFARCTQILRQVRLARMPLLDTQRFRLLAGLMV